MASEEKTIGDEDATEDKTVGKIDLCHYIICELLELAYLFYFY